MYVNSIVNRSNAHNLIETNKCRLHIHFYETCDAEKKEQTHTHTQNK